MFNEIGTNDQALMKILKETKTIRQNYRELKKQTRKVKGRKLIQKRHYMIHKTQIK